MINYERWMARSLRYIAVNAAFMNKDITEDEAKELLDGPLSPDDNSTIYNDRKLLGHGRQALIMIEESEGVFINENDKSSHDTSQ